MHYKNGREAKNGDTIILIPPYAGSPAVVGVLHDAVPGIDSCNGKLAVLSAGSVMTNLAECLHIDDAKAVLAGNVPDTSKPEEVVTAGQGGAVTGPGQA